VSLRRNLRDHRLHDVHHYVATLLVAKGVPMRVVVEILGHSKMATTADLCAQVMPAAHREVADLIDQSLRPKKQDTAIP
jgi:integrase